MDPSSSSSRDLGIKDLWAMFTRNWLTIVTVTILGSAAGGGWALFGVHSYRAEANTAVVSALNPDLPSARAGDELAKSKALSYKALATSRPVAEKVRIQLGWEATAADLLDDVSVTVPPESTELRVEARAGTAEGAATLANTWIEVLSAQIDSLEGAAPDSRTPGNEEPVALVTIALAEEAAAQSSSGLITSVLGGALAGLLLSLVAVFVRSAAWK